jgi:CDGSH-type Zn-finger protein
MAAKDAVVITAYRDGPLLVRGRFQLVDPGGAVIDPHRSPVALCRCGKSRIRPFCDGTHKRSGFRTGSPGLPSTGTSGTQSGRAAARHPPADR